MYHLTEEGAESICFFENKISDAIKDDIEDFFVEKKFSLKNEVSVKPITTGTQTENSPYTAR